jgi:hypothetical protein
MLPVAAFAATQGVRSGSLLAHRESVNGPRIQALRALLAAAFAAAQRVRNLTL